AAAAALMGLCASPAVAADASLNFRMFGVSADPSVDAFYAARQSAPVWLGAGQDGSAARDLIAILKRAQVEGLSEGPEIAAQAEAAMARAKNGDRTALVEADRLLSTGWVHYVQMLQRPAPGMTYAESGFTPRTTSPQEILQLASAAPSLDAHLRTVADVNPLYASIRDAAFAQFQATGVRPDPRILASLEQTRVFPAKGRYVVVDAASARLMMVQDGQTVDSMKVIVGKSDPSTQTPMLASVIHYATLNPYWHVTPDLVRSLIAKNVLDQGYGYLKAHGYQLFTSYGDDAVQLSPDKVDWKAVAAGRQTVEVRQLPGPGNSMGHLKFGFANPYDIYLHDTPNKDLFAQDDRDLSHGCIRLEDAERLGRWMLGQELMPVSTTPEQHVTLPTPIPIYITYLTAQPNGGQLGFVDDVYGRDSVSAGS